VSASWTNTLGSCVVVMATRECPRIDSLFRGSWFSLSEEHSGVIDLQQLFEVVVPDWVPGKPWPREGTAGFQPVDPAHKLCRKTVIIADSCSFLSYRWAFYWTHRLDVRLAKFGLTNSLWENRKVLHRPKWGRIYEISSKAQLYPLSLNISFSSNRVWWGTRSFRKGNSQHSRRTLINTTEYGSSWRTALVSWGVMAVS